MHMKRTLVLLTGILSAACLHAANWPQWRGPEFNGSSPETGLPEKFSKTENVVWAAPMPGPAGSTPVIWNDVVFATSIDTAKKSRVALCLDRKSGKVKWQKDIGPGVSQDDRSNYASPSPITDGKHVWFFFGSGDLACFDMDGKQVWARNIQKDYGKFAFLWTFSSSPLLFDGKLYLQVLQRDTPVNRADPLGSNPTDKPIESFLLALDPANGKELFKVVRPSDARVESREAFSTPIPHTHNGRTEILVVGGDCITGHAPDTGKELWRWGTWNPQKITHWRLVPSPVAAEGVALACGPKNAPVYAVKLGGNGKLNDSAIQWQSTERDVTSDVPTPLYYKGKFYILNGGKRKLLCVEPKDGKVVWSGDLESRSVFEASPTAAEDKIFVMDHKGNVFVAAANTGEFKLLHSTNMADEGDNNLRSSIAIAHGQIFIRTGKTLHCIGKK
jgi:outer membrane protein assembly factor BamB